MISLTRQNNRIYFRGSQKEVEIIKKSLTFSHPEADNIPAYRDGHWDGFVRFYDKWLNYFSIGFLSIVIDKLNQVNYKFDYTKNEIYDVSKLVFKSELTTVERSYQPDAVKTMIIRGYGIVEAPTQSGKTMIATEYFRQMLLIHTDLNICFLTESSEVYEQSKGRIQEYLQMEVGVICGEVFKPNQVTIAMAQTINSATKKVEKGKLTGDSLKKFKTRKSNFTKFLKGIDILLVDEAHEFLGKNRIQLLKNFSKKTVKRFGITATPYKLDKMANLNMLDTIGDVIFRISEEELVSKSVLCENKTILLMIQHKKSKNTEYRALHNELILNNKKRDDILKKVIAICESLELKLLCLFSSVKHGTRISQELNIPFLSGEDNMFKRNMVKDKFLSKHAGTLFASDIWGKGVSLIEVEVIYNVDGGKEQSLIIQRRGRAMGASANKFRAMTIDFIDEYEEYFNEHSLQRIEAYEQKSNDITVIDCGSESFLEECYNNISKWFYGE